MPGKSREGFGKRWANAQERHRTRHRPTGFRFAIADGIEFLNAAHWDGLTNGRSVFLSRGYLRALEAACPVNLSPRYALAYDGPAPVAALVIQVVDLRTQEVRTGASSQFAKVPAVTRVPWKRLLTSRVLTCGNLLAWGPHGVAFASDRDPAQTWAAVADVLYRIRRAERLSGRADLVIVKDLGEAEIDGIEALETFGYRPFETEPDMVLDLPEDATSLDDYLGALKAKYRKGARSILKSVEKAGLRLEPLTDVVGARDALHTLYEELCAQATTRLFTLSPDYLPSLADALGDAFGCIVLRDAETERIVGFVTLIQDGTTAVGYYMGFDRELNQTTPIYFRLLYAVIEEAARRGCRRVSFGRTALEPKARLGARPVPLRSWTRHRLPLVNAILRPLLREVPHDEPPKRDPFKQ